MATNVSPITMNSQMAGLVSKDLSSILKADPSITPFISWLMQGGNVDQLMGTAEGAALGALIKDPATLQAANLGIQAMNGVDVTQSLESAAAKAALSGLNLNKDQTNLANLGLMAAAGASPVGWAMEGLSLGQQYLPDIFGVAGEQTAANKFASQAALPKVSTDGSFTIMTPTDRTRNIIKDNATGKMYNGWNAYTYAQDTQKYLGQGYPANIASLLAASTQATDNPSGRDPAIWTDAQKKQTQDQILAEGQKIGTDRISPGGYLRDQILTLAALSDPKLPQEPIAGMVSGIEGAIAATDLTNPQARQALIDRIKKSYGTAVPPSLGTELQNKYAADTKAYQSKIASTSPEIQAIVDKYTAKGAAPPPLGSMDAVVMAKYFNAPESVITKLAQEIPNIKDSPAAKTLASFKDSALTNAMAQPNALPPPPLTSPAAVAAPAAPAPTAGATPAATVTPTTPAVAAPAPPAGPTDYGSNYFMAYQDALAGKIPMAQAQAILDKNMAAANASNPTVVAAQQSDATKRLNFLLQHTSSAQAAIDAVTAEGYKLSDADKAMANKWSGVNSSGDQVNYGSPLPMAAPVAAIPTKPAQPQLSAMDTNLQNWIGGVHTVADIQGQAQNIKSAYGIKDFNAQEQGWIDAAIQGLNQPPPAAAPTPALVAATPAATPTGPVDYGTNYFMAYQDALAGKIPMEQAQAILNSNLSAAGVTPANAAKVGGTVSAPLPMAQSPVQLPTGALPMATNSKPPP